MFIRAARLEDARSLADLATQLSYPSTPEQIVARLDRVLGYEEHAVLVAEDDEKGVVGWAHVYVHRGIEMDGRAELAGLVVDEQHRGTGIGETLMQAVEAWALEHGCASVGLRSNVIRERAHAFYRRLGYKQVKTQHAFRKEL
ncbi:MAG TPA: GNAT family N-acetyltransferase [Candidatus Polarisedimenticolia bacterium]|nr:GNAT family N-acetyltransferase [Candidatus Polarisedimenticolia bacterium]